MNKVFILFGLYIVSWCVAGEEIVLMGDSWLDTKVNTYSTQAIQNMTEVPVINIAVGGSKTADVLALLRRYDLSTVPEGTTVILDIGGNDFLSGISEKEVQQNLEEIIWLLQSNNIKIILVEVPKMASKQDIIRGNLHESPIYEQIHADFPDVYLSKAMVDLVNIPKFRGKDIIHLNLSGYIVYDSLLVKEYLENFSSSR